jgi:segregation and condensation protein B
MEQFGWSGRRVGPRSLRDPVATGRQTGGWRNRLAIQAITTGAAGRIAGGHGEMPTAAGGSTGSSPGDGFWERDDRDSKRQRVEAVLLLSRAPLTSRKLSQLAGLADATEARTLVRELNERYLQRGRAFRAEEVAGGYQLMTRPTLAPWLRRLGHIPKTVQLTPPALETVSIVAYRQPVLRADIEAIRGVACGEILRQLMEKDLVRISGRSEELGRPYLYSTTKRFLQTFGLRDAAALPALEESEIDISEDPDWSDATPPTDRIPDPRPVPGTPEEESDVSFATDNVVIDPAAEDDAMGGTTETAPADASPAAVIEGEEDEFYVDDDEEDDELDDDFDDEWIDDEDEDDDDEDELDEDEDADWEEVDDEDDDEWDEEDEDDDLDDWDEGDDDLDDDEEDEDWE